MRLDRFLANQAYGSRSEARRLIRSGKITVNGRTAQDESMQINPSADQISCLGQAIRYREFIYLMLHKPAGVVSATVDGRERTVLDLIDPKYRHKNLFPVGRLDKDTEGLLILTNHGALGHQLLAPKQHVPRQYYAKVEGMVSTADQEAFRNGILLEDGYRTLPAELEIIKKGENSGGSCSEVTVVLREGKYHQIKRMFQALGKRVVYLKRTAMGDLRLDPALQPGEYRELTDEELEILRCR
ncbi:MAG: rRNA pseudouridine synthase [Firmicutes bacterium]|nr:rRNA pseudouridine synthase [Bacillota bacterium]